MARGPEVIAKIGADAGGYNSAMGSVAASSAVAGGAILGMKGKLAILGTAIGVLGAVSVATAALLPEGPAAELADVPEGDEKTLSIEHPTGEMTVIATLKGGEVTRTAILRTARKLMDGSVFV